MKQTEKLVEKKVKLTATDFQETVFSWSTEFK